MPYFSHTMAADICLNLSFDFLNLYFEKKKEPDSLKKQ
jgi:hypothetical protein